MMTAEEARKELERKKDSLKACQLAFFQDRIKTALKNYEGFITVDLEIFSREAQHEMMRKGYRVSARKLDDGKIRVQVDWS